MTLVVRPAEREKHAAAIANMMQLYTHDFSEFWVGQARGELGSDGRFEDYPLGAYWTEPQRIPLIISLEHAPIGFALINAYAHSGEPVDHSMAEFFIVRKHRRSGRGFDAATAILLAYPGQWEIAVVRANVAARAFWGRVIGAHHKVSALETLDRDDARWNGAIFRFRTG